LLLPADWSLAASLIAIGLVFLAIVLFLVVIWLDYRSSRIVGPRNLLKVVAVGFPVIGAAEALERTYGFNWWLTAAAIAMIVAPIWWLYLRRSRNGQQQ
jgi:cbb3-type cytochrome oxidase subunit 3